jgi:hypothetical protein
VSVPAPVRPLDCISPRTRDFIRARKTISNHQIDPGGARSAPPCSLASLSTASGCSPCGAALSSHRLRLADFLGVFGALRWCGRGRGRFLAYEFRRYCDSHAPSLILIRDTGGFIFGGFIFGGFTPVKWESPAWNGKRGSERS